MFCDIALNPGPVNFGFVNSRSMGNKGPLINDTIVSNNLDILALAETHIQISNTDRLLRSVTPPGFQLIHRPLMTCWGGSVGLLTRKDLPAEVVDTPTWSTFQKHCYICCYPLKISCGCLCLLYTTFMFLGFS